jgi:pSer/pThr/pTyr-binding forkhead associated (FHA) protein
MICKNCGEPTQTQQCSNCNHDATGLDSTTSISPDNSIEEPHHFVNVTDIPIGKAALVVLRGPNSGEIWTLDSDKIEVGRTDDNSLFLDDITVSRKHAIIEKLEDAWQLTDLGSLNGCYVNKILIDVPTGIKTGDEIQIGKFRFSFYEASKK